MKTIAHLHQLLQVCQQIRAKFLWSKTQRASQKIPEIDWYIWLILAGRGWGKTRTGAETVRYLVTQKKVSRVALVARTLIEAQQIMLEGESGIFSVFPPWQQPKYYNSQRKIIFYNGVEGYVFSSQAPNQLRGVQHDFAWCDELAFWDNAENVWNNLVMGMRLGSKPRIIITTTPRFTPLLKRLLSRVDKDVLLTRGVTYENSANLPANFLRDLQDNYGNSFLGRQEIYADLLTVSPQALWKQSYIENYRVQVLPPLLEVVVAVDPAMSSQDSANETAIIVVAKGKDKCGYVLEDLSGNWTPEEWADKVNKAFIKWKANLVLCEINQGGDLVARNLLATYPHIRYKSVRAMRSKAHRAEPVSLLYAQGKIHHYGIFLNLEKQMLTWIPVKSSKSPDRIDALVWGLSELFLKSNYHNYKLRVLF